MVCRVVVADVRPRVTLDGDCSEPGEAAGVLPNTPDTGRSSLRGVQGSSRSLLLLVSESSFLLTTDRAVQIIIIKKKADHEPSCCP